MSPPVPPSPASSSARQPVIFLAHGAPPLLDLPAWVAELRAWAGRLPRPAAVLMLSAHWQEQPVTLGATTTRPLIYDFQGFEERFYRIEYPAPGAPALAERVETLLSPHGPVARLPGRGLDHGAWVPLLAMYPEADVPVLQVSVPGSDPRSVLDLGRALAPLRDEGVLLVGSGFITHNLRSVDWSGLAPPPTWAREFDAWTAEALAHRDADGLVDFLRRGPGARQALPTTEHFLPLLATVGASTDGDPLATPIGGFWLGSLSRRSVQLG